MALDTTYAAERIVAVPSIASGHARHLPSEIIAALRETVDLESAGLMLAYIFQHADDGGLLPVQRAG